MDSKEPLPFTRVLAEEYARLRDDDEGRPAPSDGRLPDLYAQIHSNAKPGGTPLTGLAISGGGIRSATFALGILQQLARLGILEKFDYLSTVSGGGYIGSWLTSFARRSPGGMEEASKLLGSRTGAPKDPLSPEIEPVRHLREYSNYLTPQLGLLSGDTWAMAASYVRNLLLNWLILVPVLIAMLMLPRLVIAVSRELPPSFFFPIAVAIGALLLIAIVYLGMARPASTTSEAAERRWLETNAAFQRLALLPFFLAAVCLAFLWPTQTKHGANQLLASILVLASLLGAIIYAGRFIVANRHQRREDVRHEAGIGTYTFKKILLETIVAILSGSVAAGILYEFFEYAFGAGDLPLKAFAYPEILAWKVFPPNLPPVTFEIYVCLAVPVTLIAFFLQSAMFVGFTSWYNEDYDREWWARASGWVLSLAFVWLVFSAVAIFGPIVIYEFPRVTTSLGTITGALAVLGGKSAKSGGPNQKETSAKMAGFNISLGLLGTIFALFILAALSLATSEVLLRPREEYKKHRNDAVRAKLLARSTYELKSKEALKDGDLEQSTGKYPALELDRYRALRHLWLVDNSRVKECLVVLGGCALLALLASLFIGVNRFSMHAFYRNRLIRAYLGASRKSREPNPFSGFDPNDNIPMHKLRPESFWYHSFTDVPGFIALMKAPGADPLTKYLAANLSERSKRLMDAAQTGKIVNLTRESLFDDLNQIIDTHDLAKLTAAANPDASLPLRNRKLLDAKWGAGQKPQFFTNRAEPRPLHLVNTTLNLVSGSGNDLAWQERKGEAFSISPLHSGSAGLGYRYSRTYGGPGGITLGTAVAISGAAASPSMGYNSSPALSFLLTLFNVRLGWWLGNPGVHGDNTYRLRDPRVGIKPILAEMLGLTDASHSYVYLSDGGHFENLGIYELVRRRCHCIIVSDAGSDGSFGFDDLGNAVRKIRIDMGINITFDEMGIYPRSEKEPKERKYWAVGRIHYSDVDPAGVDGYLLYIKPTFYGKEETRDVYNYAVTHDTFPHETTADQFFSESQFESYRALGEITISDILAFAGSNVPKEPCELISAARNYVEDQKKKEKASQSAPAAIPNPQ